MFSDKSPEDNGDCGIGFSYTFTLVLSIVNVGIVWWALPLILNFKRPQFITRAIAWSALMATQPGAAAYFAIKASRTPEERLRLYYNGMPIHGAKADSDDPENPTKMPWYMVSFHVVIEAGVAMYPALSAAFLRWTCETESNDVKPIVMLWLYPSVPAAVFGLWITLDAKLLRLSKGWSIFWAYVMILGIGLVLFIPVLRSIGSANAIVVLPAVAYFAMSIHSSMNVSQRYVAVCWAFLGGFYGFVARNAPVAFSAITGGSVTGNSLPFPEAMDLKAFAVCYLAVGAICSAFSIWCLRMDGGPRDHMRDLEDSRLEDFLSATRDMEANRAKSSENSILVTSVP